MAKILVVDQSPDIYKTLEAALNGHSVRYIESAKGAENELEQTNYDLILLDVLLPDGDGIDLCSKFKLRDQEDVPVILVSQETDTQKKIKGFSVGAEDYIVKPYDPEEMKARIEARLRKRQERLSHRNTLAVGDLYLEIAAQQVTWKKNGQSERLDLTPLEFKILLHLARHPNQVLKREQLLTAIWGNTVFITDRTIDSHVSHLRKKIARSSCFIYPVYGLGYRLAVSDSREAMN